MRKLLGAVLALCLVASLAYAGYNVRPKPWGGASLEHAGDKTEISYGDAGLVVSITGIEHSLTHHFVSGKSGKLVKIFAILDEVLAADDDSPVFTFFIAPASGESQALGTGQFHRVSDYNGNQANQSQISWAQGTTGLLGHVTSVSWLSGVTSNNVKQGDIIAIVGDGGPASLGNGATFTIIIQ